MRWLNHLLRAERGASAVMVGILMIPLLGFLAIAIDVGALYAEKAQLQNGADAAAIAIARNCAVDGLCNSPTTVANQARDFANVNSNDAKSNASAVVPAPSPAPPNSVQVVATTLEASGASAIRPFFAIGAAPTTMSVVAQAEWGSPEAANVLPLAISYCEFRPALDGKLQLIRYDRNLECAGRDGHPIPGGFGWIDPIADTCEAAVSLTSETVPSDPGNDPPTSDCDTYFNAMLNTTILVPIFDRAYASNGNDAVTGAVGSYHIYAFAAFRITGWKFSGNNNLPMTSLDPVAQASPATKCTGNCRGIQGYFDHWVSVDSAEVQELGGPNLGAEFVRLIK
ncbi:MULTISPECIES: pilus assembly protein TadG-related protein [unclassified Cryobacterium]|uniref:pilus assembly protein TadG-related protein n=1 Tax=unclassified Cryobacterium TaxID=2649013 RepID=UPI000CE55B5E|nr:MULTISPECIES: pilus assembly protein TadG-related protein [unclassified Cryobacterium]